MSFLAELALYVGRIRLFGPRDWIVYLAWVGLMASLTLCSGALLLISHTLAVELPPEALFVPLGALVFTLSIAIDTIGHRTVYRADIEGAEGLVHTITASCGIAACALLLGAPLSSWSLWIPAAALTGLSFLYSFVDEVFHWRRYVRGRADRVEMASHVGILLGHTMLMTAWWLWFARGYAGVGETFARLGWRL